jgi:glutaredoxin 3
MKNNITIYTKAGCMYCSKAKELLNSLDLMYDEIVLNPYKENYELQKNELFNFYNHKSFPIIIINKRLLGGYSDLVNIYNTLKLHKFYNQRGFNIM